MPVELFREVPTSKRVSAVSVAEQVVLGVAALGFIAGMLVLAFAWSWA